MEALIFLLLLTAFGAWLRDQATRFKEIEQRMTLRAANARLSLALEAADDSLPDPSERTERIAERHRARDPLVRD